MLRRSVVLAVACAGLASPAYATPTTLFPGVSVDRSVQFTLHGPVGLTMISAPRPGEGNGLYALAPVLARGTVAGGRDRLTRIERALSPQATVVGINGDFPAGSAALPAGIVLQGGALVHSPLPLRSSIGIDTGGNLHVDRVSFVGTWKGTGQRRPLVLVNQAPGRSQVSLFTPAYGAAVPRGSGTAEVVLEPFPTPVPGNDLQSTVVAVGAGGGETIPPDGAVLQAAGTAVAPLKAEAPVGTPVTVRLILKPEWAGVTSALGGGPVLVRGGKAVFRSGVDCARALVSLRAPRAAVGQLADGRVILVAVDGGRPGSSVGMTSFELGQTLVRLGAVTASAVESGGAVTAAFDGNLLSDPSDAGGERAVNEALLVEYYGVYASPAPVPLVNGDPGATSEPLEYKLVRPATVTAQVVGPDGVAHVLEAGVAHQPGTYDTSYSSFDAEGAWHWQVTATDDLGRVSTIDRPFRYDTTLRALAVAGAQGSATARFALGRAATVRLRIETMRGVTVRLLPAVQLGIGLQRLTWDGRLVGGARAPSGTYVAHVFASSDVGASDLSATFALRAGTANER